MNGVIRKALNTAYVVPACLWEKRMPFASARLIRAVQKHRMRHMVRHAWKHVPFYRRAMEERGLQPSDIREPEDLSLLPLISNEDMRRNPSIFHSTMADPGRDMVIRTGNYKEVLWSRHAALQWFARISRTREVINNLTGKKSGYTEVYVNSPVNCNLEINKYWEKNLLFLGRASAKERLDANDLYEKITRDINRLRPDILYCFGSFSEHLVKYINSRKLPFNPPAIWVYGSDTMSCGTRKLIEESFGCMVYSAYNMNEMGAMSFECERRDGYHLNTDSCHVRIGDENGESVKDGEAGEVIISNLVNTSTIFLNYRTGDRGRLSAEPCSCGRTLPLLKDLMGRISDTVYSADGLNISFGQLDGQVGEVMEGVALYQIIQERPGHVCWHLVPLPGCDRNAVEARLGRIMEKVLPFPNRVEVQWVDELEFTPGQKRKFVIHRFEAACS